MNIKKLNQKKILDSFKKIPQIITKPSKIVSKLQSIYSHYRYKSLINNFFIDNSEKENTIIIASYPKSGNTYLRFIFANIISLKEEAGKTVDFHRLDKMLPSDVYIKDLKSSWDFETLPCILKTHRSHLDCYKKLRSIYMFRNPLDVMVSGYHYFKNRNSKPEYAETGTIDSMRDSSFTGSASDYLRENLTHWCNHYSSWINKADVSTSYERMKQTPTEEMNRILNKFDLQIDSSIVEESVKRSSIERIQQLEDKTGTSEKMPDLEGKFARSGNVGQWQEYFDQEDLEFVNKTMEKFNIELSDFELTLGSKAHP